MDSKISEVSCRPKSFDIKMDKVVGLDNVSPTNSQIKAYNKNIKEKLNLHVKRRLQETVNTNEHNIEQDKKVKSTASSPARGVKKMKIKQNCPIVASVEDECSKDGTSNSNDYIKEKDSGPDMLTMVLNERKASLLRDPSVASFLQNVMEVLARTDS